MLDGEMSDDVLSKGKFAEHIGVSAGRVSQMISEGLIGADALKGQGRNAKVIVELAKKQISLRRDIGQALGNGLTTNLQTSPSSKVPVSGAMASDTDEPEDELPDIDKEIKLARLERELRTNRRAAEEDEASTGRFTETVLVEAEMNRIAGQMINIFDGMLPSLAGAVAEKFEVPSRDVLHVLRHKFVELRGSVEAKERERASKLPDTLETTIETSEHQWDN